MSGDQGGENFIQFWSFVDCQVSEAADEAAHEASNLPVIAAIRTNLQGSKQLLKKP